MKLAILFWFYKDIEVCENHLKLLKRYNPDLQIFGLFGGAGTEAQAFKNKLSSYLSDFYQSPIIDPGWKWRHGDLVILDWYKQRGTTLEWDSIIPVQWDMLVFDSLSKLFADMKTGEIYLSGSQLITPRLKRRWDWTTPYTFFSKEKRKELRNYLDFKRNISIHYNYQDPVWCCLFILQVFPRIFFEKYLEVSNREIGFLEYKIPTLAKIFGIPFFEKNLGVEFSFKREDRGKKPMNAIPIEIADVYIRTELEKPDGWRIFHPYYNEWKL